MYNQKLVTLTGPAPIEKQEIQDYLNLTNRQAGVLVLEMIGNVFPDLTFNDFRPEFWPLTKKLIHDELKLSGPCTKCDDKKMGHCRLWHPHHCNWGNTGGDIADKLGETIDFLGDKGGDIVRLVTDEEVLDGAQRIGAAILTSGGSAGFDEILSNLSGDGGGGELLDQLVGLLGGKSKSGVQTASTGFDFGGVPKEVLWIGGGVVGLILIVSLFNKG